MEFTAGSLIDKMRGLGKVLQMEGLNNEANYAFYRIGPVIEAEYRIFEGQRQALLEKHVKRDEDGERISEGEGEAFEFVMEDREAFEEEYKLIAEIILTVHVQPVRLSLILDSVGCVNAATMIQLGELLEDDAVGIGDKAPLEIVKNT